MPGSGTEPLTRSVVPFGIEIGPDRLDSAPHYERLLPTVRELESVGTSDRIFDWPELAQEVENGIIAGPLSPESEALLSPACKDVEPFPVLWKRDLDLDLLARGDASSETFASFQKPADERVVLL